MSDGTILTRRELYDLVWSKPMAELAREFGLSDVGLAMICARHRVPHPPRGYWAKRAAGKPVRAAHFIEISDHQLNRVVIQPGLLQLPSEVRAVVARTRAEQKARERPTPAARPDPTPAKDLDRIHAAVRPTARALRKAKPDRDGGVSAVGDGLCGVMVGSTSMERLIGILDDLTQRLAARGLDLVPTGQAMSVTRDAQTLVFKITEKTKVQPHVPTPDELAAEDRRQARLRRHADGRLSWSEVFSTKAYPEKDRVHTDELVLQVDGWDRGLRRSWADGRTQRLETLLDGIVDGFDLLLAARKAEHDRREEQQRKAEELARRRALAKRRTEREAARLAFVETISTRRAEIARLETALATIGPTTVDGGLGRMRAWVAARLDARKETLAPVHLSHELDEAGLFPAEDPLHDPLGDPPAGGWGW